MEEGTVSKTALWGMREYGLPYLWNILGAKGEYSQGKLITHIITKYGAKVLKALTNGNLDIEFITKTLLPDLQRQAINMERKTMIRSEFLEDRKLYEATIRGQRIRSISSEYAKKHPEDVVKIPTDKGKQISVSKATAQRIRSGNSSSKIPSTRRKNLPVTQPTKSSFGSAVKKALPVAPEPPQSSVKKALKKVLPTALKIAGGAAASYGAYKAAPSIMKAIKNVRSSPTRTSGEEGSLKKESMSLEYALREALSEAQKRRKRKSSDKKLAAKKNKIR